MKKQTSNFFKAFAAAALVAAMVSVATVAGARQGVVSVPLYRGLQDSLDLGSWGSGSAQEVDKPVLVGSRAIRITTQGLYQGGRLAFRQPIDLTPAFANPKTYLRMQTRFDSTQVGSVGGSGGPGGGPPAGFGGAGSFGGVETARFAASPFERMRFVLTMADGTQYEMIRPVVVPPSEDPDSYVPLSFPIKAILKKGDGSTAAIPTGEGAKLKEISIFGDKYQQFIIGEMEIVTDDTEISAASLEEPIVYTEDVITFSASAEAGASTLRYSWDFDSSDGIQEDAVGRTVSQVFKTAGKRTVTLTVADEDGIKQSDQKSVSFEVLGGNQ
ncbi:MAG: PKD domain-containing protein [Akkermansiaceae bacterium]|nr:PKD domain-containing protein [Armatimonadota bacterium]